MLWHTSTWYCFCNWHQLSWPTFSNKGLRRPTQYQRSKKSSSKTKVKKLKSRYGKEAKVKKSRSKNQSQGVKVKTQSQGQKPKVKKSKSQKQKPYVCTYTSFPWLSSSSSLSSSYSCVLFGWIMAALLLPNLTFHSQTLGCSEAASLHSLQSPSTTRISHRSTTTTGATTTVRRRRRNRRELLSVILLGAGSPYLLQSDCSFSGWKAPCVLRPGREWWWCQGSWHPGRFWKNPSTWCQGSCSHASD